MLFTHETENPSEKQQTAATEKAGTAEKIIIKSANKSIFDCSCCWLKIYKTENQKPPVANVCL